MIWNWMTDVTATWRARARFRRLISEQALELAERGNSVRDTSDGTWHAMSRLSGTPEVQRVALRDEARRLANENPHARNVLRLLEVYVAGPGFALSHVPLNGGDPRSETVQLTKTADKLWRQFLEQNRLHFRFGEYARRCWRDGECFLRLYDQLAWPPTVRFVDPEEIGPDAAHPESEGILTEPDDVESPVAYIRCDRVTGEAVEEIPVQEMLHTRMNCDSNEKRGISSFTSIVKPLETFSHWLETELQARKLQASIVLWRRVQGSPAQAAALAEGAARDGYGHDSESRRERFRPGTILTTSQGTDLRFLQPDTNFGDAINLGRAVLLCAAAGAGLPEFMLTGDASNGNYASTMVAEGPAVKLFESEQQFFAQELSRLWEWVMRLGMAHGLLPNDFLEQVTVRWTFPSLVNRDRARERLADVRLVETGVLSRAEVARRELVDPAIMSRERLAETELQPGGAS